MFGENVKLYDHNHIFNDKSVNMQRTYLDRNIIIGNNNWIGSDVVFLSKAEVGDYNVIASKVIVNKNYDNENIIKLIDNYSIKKIKYK